MCYGACCIVLRMTATSLACRRHGSIISGVCESRVSSRSGPLARYLQISRGFGSKWSSEPSIKMTVYKAIICCASPDELRRNCHLGRGIALFMGLDCSQSRAHIPRLVSYRLPSSRYFPTLNASSLLKSLIFYSPPHCFRDIHLGSHFGSLERVGISQCCVPNTLSLVPYFLSNICPGKCWGWRVDTARTLSFPSVPLRPQ